jgi:hypothetical protein
MSAKICQVIFSTNRLEFLMPTLDAQERFLDFAGCEVHGVFIDDYPQGRNDNLIRELVRSYGYREVILHQQNQGLSVTWSEFWDLIRDRDYDYVWHQEDDVEILEPVAVRDLIELLRSDPDLSQVRLSRQAWYQGEQDPQARDDDYVFRQFRYVKDPEPRVFSPMASLYAHGITRLPYRDTYDINLNEGMIAQYLQQTQGLVSAQVRNSQGHNLINHIGDWFVGKRVLAGEPGHEVFSGFDPNVRYSSRDGSLWPGHDVKA